MSDDTKSGFKRKYHLKSRKGCSTCKRRRVKCDEMKPLCNNCVRMKLVCGYIEEITEEKPPRKKPTPAVKTEQESESPHTQQATPAKTPSPGSGTDTIATQMAALLGSGLLSAGSLNNINLSHLVNNLSNIGDLSGLGNLASLSSLAVLAQLPIDLSALGGLSEVPSISPNNGMGSIAGALGRGLSGSGPTSDAQIASSHLLASQIAPEPQIPSESQILSESQIPSSHLQSEPSLTSEPSLPSGSDLSNGSASTGNGLGMPTPGISAASASGLSSTGMGSLGSILAGLGMGLGGLGGMEAKMDTPMGESASIGLNGTPRMSTPGLNAAGALSSFGAPGDLNLLDLRLMYHYTTRVAGTITGAGISDTDIWNHDVPMLAFEYPFLMHALLAFSATHLSRTEKGLDHCVTSHRGDALRLLREAILDINSDNTDALVASALILIMDLLANASVPSLTSPKSLPASAWIFHVKGAATILTAVWPLTEASRFYKFISVDLGDLGDIINSKSQVSPTQLPAYAHLECHDNDIADLYPVPLASPYLITLAYLNKLHKERYKADFILRIFAFPALLDKDFLTLLMAGDIKAMRIMRSYYNLLRAFTTEMKDKVWFLEGVSLVLPVDVEEYAGGAGGTHMMLDFLGGGPAIVDDHEVDKDLSMLDPGGQMANKLIDTDNLPSEITSTLDIMQGDGIMGMK